jgi:phosphohistidine phosphatase
MKLIFLRHGIAEDKKNSDTDMDDSRRLLKKDGRVETKTMVKSFKDLFKEVDVVYTSPMARAAQTAEVILKYFPKKQFEIMETLDSSLAVEEFLREIKSLQYKKTYCFVGHEPHLSTAISRLMGAQDSSIQLDKSGIAVLEGDSFSDLSLTMLVSPQTLWA